VIHQYPVLRDPYYQSQPQYLQDEVTREDNIFINDGNSSGVIQDNIFIDKDNSFGVINDDNFDEEAFFRESEERFLDLQKRFPEEDFSDSDYLFWRLFEKDKLFK
jgi:hypothetical protein